MRKTIYILRHAETDFNAKGIIQGSGVDSSINEIGRKQAAAFFEKYQHIPFQLIYTSALQRTHQTVEGFIKKNLPHQITAHLNEINWGKHEGKVSTPTSILEYNGLISAWQNGDFEARVEGGESAAELMARLEIFWAEITQRPEELILVCTHGRTLRCLLCLIHHQNPDQMENYLHANTGLMLVEYDGQASKLLLNNDLSHL
jgi:probable phosphoglycerate mutase